MLRSIILAAAIGAVSVLGDDAKCSLDKKCPKDTPCCSQYGECGIGAFCLGGCDPRSSFSLDSCVPAPVCKDSHTKFDSLDSVVDVSKYLGDASKATWMAQGEPQIHDDKLLLTMGKNTDGTVLASTAYMWYGRVKAKLKTSRGKGVVTAFILLSDVKDEIDYEFVGSDLEQAQTNFYFQGILNYKNSGNNTASDTYHEMHEYEINWTPDKIEWLVDGKVGRTAHRKDTWNSTTNQWEFPQTPARVQLSIWPGGKASNAKGTIDWAGGVIDWDSSDIKNPPHYYFATFEEVTIECYDAKSAPGTNKGKSYTYKDDRGTNDTVVDGDDKTILASFQGTGLDMDKGKSDKDNKDAKTIPGGGEVSVGQDHSGKNDASSGGGKAGDLGQIIDPKTCSASDFHQDCNEGDGNGNGNGGGGKNAASQASASVFAMAIAGCALYLL